MFFSVATETPTFILRTRDTVSGVNVAQNSLWRRDVSLRDGADRTFVRDRVDDVITGPDPARGPTYQTAECWQRLLGCGFHETNTSSGIPDSSADVLQHDSCGASAEGAALASAVAAATMASAKGRRLCT